MHIDWNSLMAALALVMVIEGVLPFLSPKRFRLTLITAAALSDRALRVLGLLAMLAGLATLYWVHPSA